MSNMKEITLIPEIVDFIKECSEKQHSESYLISVLHKVQAKYGYLSIEHMQEVAELLGVPASQVSGVATFYHFFRLKPVGKYNIQFCMGTACYVKGAQAIIDVFQNELGIEMGEVTKDGLFSLELTRCLGVCGLAPVVMINEKVYGKLSDQSVPGIISEIRQEENSVN